MKDRKKSLTKTNSNIKLSPISDFSLSTGKYFYNEITTFETSAPCLNHMSEHISHFCENCQYQPLCGICLQEGNHKMHSVKNVEKASKIVQRILTQILITSRAKYNLMQMLGQQVQSRKSELKNELNDFLQSINQSFDSIQESLLQRRKTILQQTHEFYKNQMDKIQQAQFNTKEESEKLSSMIQILSEKSEKLDPSYLCLFYFQKKDILQDTLEQGHVVYQGLKKLVPYIKWAVQTSFEQQIKDDIQSILVQTTEDQIQVSIKPKTQKLKSQKKQITLIGPQKSKKIVENFETTGFYTPKHISSKKQKYIRHRVTNKIAKEMKQSKKLLTLVLHDSLQKISPKNRQTPTMLHKKVKNKPRYQKVE